MGTKIRIHIHNRSERCTEGEDVKDEEHVQKKYDDFRFSFFPCPFHRNCFDSLFIRVMRKKIDLYRWRRGRKKSKKKVKLCHEEGSCRVTFECTHISSNGERISTNRSNHEEREYLGNDLRCRRRIYWEIELGYSRAKRPKENISVWMQTRKHFLSRFPFNAALLCQL